MKDYRNIFNKVIPYHTDDSMSLYEFVGRLYEYIKNFEGTLDEAHEKIDGFITQVTGEIDEFKASTTGEMSDFIDRFDGQLDETTTQVLLEWKNDGTLEEIISLVWEGKADKTYVDNLINQTASGLTSTLTEGYTQADSNLRDQVNANVSASENRSKGLITANTQEIARVDSDLNTKITGVETTANAVKVQFISGSVLEYARTMTGQFKLIASSMATDVPTEHRYSTGLIFRREETLINVVLFSYHEPTKAISNVYYDLKWSGWRELGTESATELLEKIIEVDGAGSGLDADTLDGYHGDDYVRSGKNYNRLGKVPIIEGGSDIGESYLQFYNNVSTRQAYIGLSSKNSTNFMIYNELNGGRIELRDKTGGAQYNQRLLATLTYGTGDAPANLAQGEIYVKV